MNINFHVYREHPRELYKVPFMLRICEKLDTYVYFKF